MRALVLLMAGCFEAAPAEAPPEGGAADCDTTWFYDADGDGWGAARQAWTGCAPPDGYVAEAGDCDDIALEVHPGAKDSCGDGRDSDCDGVDPSCDLLQSGVVEGGWRFGVDAAGSAGAVLAAAGDLDGDGVEEVLVGAPKAGGGGGAVYLLSGPITGEGSLGDVPAWTGDAALGYLGAAVVGLGDVDGDGLAEVAVSEPGWGDGVGRVHVLDGASGLDGAALLVAGAGMVDVGSALAAGDLDGDGRAEVAVATRSTGADTAVVIASPTGGSLAAALAWSAPAEASAGRAVEVADVDADGVVDLIVGAPESGAQAGAVYVVHGPVTTGGALEDADQIV